MAFGNYNPKKIALYFDGVRITGFMDGTFVLAEMDEDAFEGHVGSDGLVTRTQNLNEMGTVTATLSQASPSNDLLSLKHLTDKATGIGYGAIMGKDINGTEVFSAAQAWIKKAPNSEFADAVSGREWVFGCARLVISSGSPAI